MSTYAGKQYILLGTVGRYRAAVGASYDLTAMDGGNAEKMSGTFSVTIWRLNPNGLMEPPRMVEMQRNVGNIFGDHAAMHSNG